MSDAEQSKIADEYFELLDKPKGARQAPRFALCVIGLVAAGKTTVLTKLRQYLPMVCPAGDGVRKLLHDQGRPPVDSVTVARIGEKVVDRLRASGYRIAYDNDFGHPAIRQRMLEYNREHGIPVVWIRVAPPEPFILRNLRHREPGHLFKDTDDAVETYYRRKQLHESNQAALDALPYAYVFDPSRPDLDDQVKAAAACILAQVSAADK